MLKFLCSVSITLLGYTIKQCSRGAPGFLKLFLCGCLYVCVSAPRLLITSGVIWTPYDWLNKLYSFCMAPIISIVSRGGLTIKALALRIKQPNKSKLALYKLLLHFYNHLYISNKTERLSYKGCHGICGWRRIKIFETIAGLGYR